MSPFLIAILAIIALIAINATLEGIWPCTWGSHDIRWETDPWWTIEYWNQPDETVPVAGVHHGTCQRCGEKEERDFRYLADAWEPRDLEQYGYPVDMK